MVKYNGFRIYYILKYILQYKMKTNQLLNYIILFLAGFLVATILIPSQPLQTNIITGAEVLDQVKLEKASTSIAAVSSKDNRGVLGKVNVEITPGDGKILVNTDPFLEPDTQYSANVAANIAQQVAIKKIGNHNLIYTFDIESDVLGGPSAGAAMTAATVSVLLGKELRNDIVITGTIREDGTIGQIGGVVEKAEAAAEKNKKIFLIPKGQSSISYYEKEIKEVKRNGLVFYKTSYIPKRFDLKDYAKDELNLEVIEVENIYDVLNIVLKK